jgi:hypothetical protein
MNSHGGNALAKGMAMDELLQWCRQQREMMLDSIRRMESKQLSLGEQRPGVGLVDQTREWTATLKNRVAELDAVLDAYGKRNA